MLADFKSAFAQARRRPLFFGGAALSLAIGMSVPTAVFSVVDAVFLQPLPVHEPDRLVQVVETVPYVGGRLDMDRVPPKMALAARDAQGLADVAHWTQGNQNTARVTTNFFTLLGARPYMGRDFSADDAGAGAASVIMSHAHWSSRFGADSAVVGRRITVAGEARRVVGIMPEGYGIPAVDFWVPMPVAEIERDAAAEKENDWPRYRTLGRLAAGHSVDRVSAELAVIYGRHYGDHAWRNIRSARAVPLASELTRGLRDQFNIWTSIAVLVVILCAVNFATVSLARGMRRRGEIAVRAAMGASSSRIVRLLVAESVIIAACGGVIALLLGAWLLEFVELWFSSGDIILTPRVRWTTVAFALVATTIVGIVFAIAPAVELAKVDLRSRLQGDAAQVTSRRGELRGRRLLVGLQLTLAVTSVTAVASLIESDRRHWVGAVSLDHKPLLLGAVASDTAHRLVVPFLERVRSAEHVGGASALYSARAVSAWTDSRDRDAMGTAMADITREYFATLGVTLRHGRMPTQAELSAGVPVVLISEDMARRAFGSDANAVGRRLHVKAPRHAARWYTVIGVVPRFGGRVFWNLEWPIYTVEATLAGNATLIVRAMGDHAGQIARLEAVAKSFGEQLKVSNIHRAQSLVDVDRAARVGRTVFVISVGALALVLAAIGMFGLTSYSTEIRAREFGIRIALGANRTRLAHSLLDEIVPLAAVSVVVALLAGARLTSFLDDRFRNPLAERAFVEFQLMPALVAGAALCVILALGAAVPLRRVFHMDVVRAMREDRS